MLRQTPTGWSDESARTEPGRNRPELTRVRPALPARPDLRGAGQPTGAKAGLSAASSTQRTMNAGHRRRRALPRRRGHAAGVGSLAGPGSPCTKLQATFAIGGGARARRPARPRACRARPEYGSRRRWRCASGSADSDVPLHRALVTAAPHGPDAPIPYERRARRVRADPPQRQRYPGVRRARPRRTSTRAPSSDGDEAYLGSCVRRLPAPLGAGGAPRSPAKRRPSCTPAPSVRGRLLRASTRAGAPCG